MNKEFFYDFLLQMLHNSIFLKIWLILFFIFTMACLYGMSRINYHMNFDI